MTSLRRLLAATLRDRSAIAATEFALMLPMLLMFSAGTIEYSRLILLTQKVQSGAFILADLTARDKKLSEAQLGNIFLALDNVIEPFDLADDGVAVVSSVGLDSHSAPVVRWQRTGSGGLTKTSQVGTEGHGATLPKGLDLKAGETIITAEVFYAFEPLFGVGLSPRTIYKVAYFRPRLGTLETLEK